MESWYLVERKEREPILFTKVIETHGSPFTIRTADNPPCPTCGQVNCQPQPEEPQHGRAQADDPEGGACRYGADSDHSEHRCHPATNASGFIL